MVDIDPTFRCEPSRQMAGVMVTTWRAIPCLVPLTYTPTRRKVSSAAGLHRQGMGATRISAAMLYDYVSCEHRPWMDLNVER